MNISQKVHYNTIILILLLSMLMYILFNNKMLKYYNFITIIITVNIYIHTIILFKLHNFIICLNTKCTMTVKLNLILILNMNINTVCPQWLSMAVQEWTEVNTHTSCRCLNAESSLGTAANRFPSRYLWRQREFMRRPHTARQESRQRLHKPLRPPEHDSQFSDIVWDATG